MPDVRLHCQIDRAWIEILCARSAADAFRMHLAGMGGDPIGGIGWSARIPLANLVCKLPDVLGVALGAALRISLSAALANFCIVEALLFGTGERLIRDQNALALISLSRAAKPQDDGAQWRVVRRPARDAGISGRNVREMSEVCAVDAETTRTFLPEQVPFEQLTAALIALRVPSAHKLENQNVLASHGDILAARNASGNHEVFYAGPMGRTIEAEYISDEKVLRLAEPLAGVRNHEKVRVIIDDSRPPELGDWPTLSEEAGRELARAVREAFGRDDIAV